MSVSSWVRLAGALARRPDLWPTAASQVHRLAPAGWWRRAPFLPLPATDYLRFRLQTMYGGETPTPEPADVLRWLDWVRSVR